MHNVEHCRLLPVLWAPLHPILLIPPRYSARQDNTVLKSMALCKLQKLQQDLHLAMDLEQQSAEYQLAVYPGGGSQYVKHRDALPDDGSDPNQRRVRLVLSSVSAFNIIACTFPFVRPSSNG